MACPALSCDGGMERTLKTPSFGDIPRGFDYPVKTNEMIEFPGISAGAIERRNCLLRTSSTHQTKASKGPVSGISHARYSP